MRMTMIQDKTERKRRNCAALTLAPCDPGRGLQTDAAEDRHDQAKRAMAMPPNIPKSHFLSASRHKTRADQPTTVKNRGALMIVLYVRNWVE